MLKLSNLKSFSKKKRKKRVGRGNASGKGNYSGRGIKGQKARSGSGKGKLKLKGLSRQIRQIPKLKGFKSIHPKLKIVNLKDLEIKFKSNQEITPQKLKEIGLIDKIKPGVKILAKGKLTKKLIVKAHQFSKAAKKQIEEAGGKAIKI